MLGINAGIGNLGVGTAQILIPALASVPILGRGERSRSEDVLKVAATENMLILAVDNY